ncbi:hypothetical protein HYFRA_00011474 [Hymenoscyphus fraxineus]|uniref:Actin cytoskeleton-regulatory complex protein SLA1 n=1 Tax=Hymenoscyphus fraxineus TaxID=746836 RepID=A0A9N9L5Q8_9HELO|nr:hypothetical protein HYFRA_00011474 [Hymenoscyphus fraxineus]
MGFLGVYKAVYDYEPHGENELSIKEGDILFVLEKSGEDDWWKAKKKASGDDEDEPVGLIPNNYIEEAQPLSYARAIYDYTRQTDEELSFSEDARLEVFDTSDPDWILVGLDGEYGFAPSNYIDLQEDADESPPAAVASPPQLPSRPPHPQVEEEPESPISPVHNPAANIAGILNQQRQSSVSAARAPPQFTPEASDEDDPPTPILPSRPIPQPRGPEPIDTRATRSLPMQGVAASPPYNRAAHDRHIDDEVQIHSPGGFHMYNINEMVSVMGKRKKMPTTLGINSATGVIMIAPEKSRDGPEQTWTAEKMKHYSIEGKHVFLELVRPSKSVDFHAGAKDTAEEIVSALGDLAGAVRAAGLDEIIRAGAGSTQKQKKGQVLYDFTSQGDDEVSVTTGDEVLIIDDTKSEDWWQVKRLRNGKEGVVPSSYIEITGTISTGASASISGINAGLSSKDQARLEEERLAKESLRTARREEDRGSEVGPGMRLPERGSSLSARDSNNFSAQQRKRDSRTDVSSRTSKSKPDPSKVRTWTDRSKSFSVEAQFLALKDGKINLHKMNGVKIAVPVVKMSVEDLEYVERKTGISLDEDKPLSDIKRQQSRAADKARRSSGSPAGATITHKPEYDWFEFFLSCDVAVGLCQRYAQAFNKDSMDESVLPDIDSNILRNVGLKEGDIIKVMRFLDKKYGRPGKKGVSFGEEGEGGIFSGPAGTLKNNTSKGRPAPPVQTNNTVDPNAFSQESGGKQPEGVATPLANAPKPAQQDPRRSGFDDDAWDVKPSSQPPRSSSVPPVSAPVQAPALTGAMQELTLLDKPLEPTRVQPAPPPQPQVTQAPLPLQAQGPPPVTPSIFAGIGNQQTGLPQQQTGMSQATGLLNQNQFTQNGGAGIARPRPTPGQYQSQNQPGLMLPPPPGRPLSAPQAQSAFSLPPLQAQSTGFQNQIAPPGQSLAEIQMRQQQQNMLQQQQNMQQNNMGMMNPNFNQFNPGAQNGFQYPMATGMPQQQQGFMNNGASPFADPRQQQPLQQQPTGFQSSFPQQQFPQPTGINSFLPPPLQPTPTGAPQQQNGFNSFNAPPMPPMPQQQAVSPLIPQKTGPPPPVRFGVSGDTKKLMPQATGRRANLSQATPQNPFGF